MKLAWLLWLASILPGHGQDQVCLATTIYLEARDQPALGQTAVAEVVLRRRDSGRYGQGVCDVVMQHKQFAPSFMSKQFRIRNFKAWDRAWKIASDTLAMWSLPASVRKQVAPGADHFYAHNIVQPQWGGTTVAVIGGHSFVRVGL
ncbi:MAG TPA: cell wall hydrolase [Xanthomonadales bacterium]|nr:cell wall hydrolase [Xanthomonadales bacterium]